MSDFVTNGHATAVLVWCASASGNSPASWFVGLCVLFATRTYFFTGVCGLVAITAYRRVGRATLYNRGLSSLAAITAFSDYFYFKVASPIR